MLKKRPKPIVLLIIDGLGLAKFSSSNAVQLANTPNLNRLMQQYQYSELDASGVAVGLPAGVMGNSEVGHIAIGTGKIQIQIYKLINETIKKSTFQQNSILKQSIAHSKQHNSNYHLLGLLSDGAVHSHINHLIALVNALHLAQVPTVYIHGIADGRDTAPRFLSKLLNQFLPHLKAKKGYQLTDIIGRYYAMDRDKRWERTRVAFEALLNKNRTPSNLETELERRYAINETDEFLKPLYTSKEGAISTGDSVIFFNFRSDRARQLTSAFLDLSPLSNIEKPNNLFFASMVEYEPRFKIPILFQKKPIEPSLAKIYSDLGFKQIHIAETEKYAHITYFLNGGRENPYKNEERILVPSIQNVPTYDLAPEMATLDITHEVLKAICLKEARMHKYDLIVFNIASPDMVGHTGNLNATIKAVEVMDKAIGKVEKACNEHGYAFAIVADHGNAEQMKNNNAPHTAHTTNRVPFIINQKLRMKRTGGLSNVTPTLLEFVGIAKPVEMTGTSLLKLDEPLKL